ncbi:MULTISPECIES: hypothetical protein [Mumia]|uniref:hypothetical protein n=1 Tax=Mumia TaxID=1546255 RepID=UPI00141DFB84|nr:hypothetical protein [Mumia sp. ZJ430]
MESDSEVRDQLRDLERAEPASYTDAPPTPRWRLPTTALASAALAALAKLTYGNDPYRIWAAASNVGLSVLVGVYLGWYQRYHEAPPSLRGKKPFEIRSVGRSYLVGAAVALAVNAATVAVAPWWLCAAVGFVTVGAGLWWYERAYARAAAAAKERLG